MRQSCFHTHTRFCDGKGEVDDFCNAAAQAGYACLGFSAHAPIFAATGIASAWHLREEEFPAYCKAVNEAKKRWEGTLAVYLGLEADYLKNLSSPARFAECGLDYLIGSVHYVPSPPENGPLWDEPLCVDGSTEDFERLIARYGGDVWALADAYYDAVDEMIEAGGFDILGHIDLIKKNNRDCRYFNERDARYVRRITRTADAAAAGRRPDGRPLLVEVNTGGIIRGKTDSPYPGPVFLRLLRERGVRCVVNADAHECAHLVNNHYAAAFAALREAGYTVADIEESVV